MIVSKRAAKSEQFQKVLLRAPLAACCLLLAIAMNGCMVATQKDMVKLDANQSKMQKTQADLVAKMSDLSVNLESLNSQLESSQQRMTVLSQKLDDLQADLQRRFNVLSGQVTGLRSRTLYAGRHVPCGL